eukprot:SAG11_NODE_334_length_10569_cov_9.662082_6_plen_74_part_00
MDSVKPRIYEPHTGWVGQEADAVEPKTWINKSVAVHFVCPTGWVGQTLTCAGKGYKLTLPKDWATKYGPALQV